MPDTKLHIASHRLGLHSTQSLCGRKLSLDRFSDPMDDYDLWENRPERFCVPCANAWHRQET